MTTKNLIINGKNEAKIIAIVPTTREITEVKAGSIYTKINEDDILKQVTHFAKPQIFWENDIQLEDLDGALIEKGTENVVVWQDTAGTAFTIKYTRKPILAEIHEYTDLEDFYRKIAVTEVTTKQMNNVEWTGIAAAVSKREWMIALSNFCKKYKVPKNTGELYLNIKVSNNTVKFLGCGINTEIEDTVSSRSLKDAELLYQTAFRILDSKAAKSRYVPTALNRLLKKYELNIVIDALKQIEFDEARLLEMTACEDKADCYYDAIGSVIVNLAQKKVA